MGGLATTELRLHEDECYCAAQLCNVKGRMTAGGREGLRSCLLVADKLIIIILMASWRAGALLVAQWGRRHAAED